MYSINHTLGMNGALYLASNALSAHHAGLEVTGHNIANVNTPGYSRERVNLVAEQPAATTVGTQGWGVNAIGISQSRSQFLDLRIPPALSTASYLQNKSDLLKQLQSSLGQSLEHTSSLTSPTAINSSDALAGDLDAFYNAFQALSVEPTSIALRQQVLQTAQVVAGKFNSISNTLTNFRNQLETPLPEDIDDINTKLASIASLNSQIMGIEGDPSQRANDFRDQRQQLIEDISQKIDLNVKEETNGSVTLRMASLTGTLLVSGVYSGNTTNAATNKLAVSGSGSTLELRGWTNGVAEIAGNLTAITQPTSGSVAATIEVAKTTIGDTFSTSGLVFDYNQMASALATQINTAHVAGFTLEGSPAYSTAGNATFFDDNNINLDAITGVTAGNIQLNVSVAADARRVAASSLAGQPNNGTNASNISALRSTTVVALGNVTVSSYYLTSINNLGGNIRTADTQYTTQKLVNKSLQDQRESISGVSLDEESANLLRFQHAYQASARLLNTLDEMAQVLLNLKR